MPATTLYYLPLSSLAVTEGRDASGASTGALFPGDALRGDSGNPAAAGGNGATAARVKLEGKWQTLRVGDDDATLNDDLGINQDTNFPIPGSNQTVVGGSAGVAAGSLVQVQYGYQLRGSDGSTVKIYALGIRPADAYDSADNTVAGIAASAPLTAGVSYRVTGVMDTPRPAYASLANCFTAGTMIAAAQGNTAVEALRPGDLVRTRDRGLQPIRWIGARLLDAAQLAARPGLHPIRLRAGALGDGTPVRDLVVSPQHRILVRSRIALRMFGTSEVLVPAKCLLGLPGIEAAADLTRVTYVHFIFDRHEVVFSNGAASESLFPGPQALKAAGAAAREELFAIFPELRDGDPLLLLPARKLVGGPRADLLALRHRQSAQPLVG